jgi:hypothetical protein
MRSFVPAALHPECEAEQHDLRIAAKRLRYVLETTGFCFGAPADNARRRARDIQDVLGELHDCDVMLPRVAEHVERLRTEDAAVVQARAGDAKELDPALIARAPHRTSYRGLEILAVHMQARRGLYFEQFVELWGELERNGTWERLERAIDREVRELRERQAAMERAAEVLAEARRVQEGTGAP